MDVELQIKTAEGNWETVTYENFPSEGVEAVLPYPEGTDKGAFDFVVAHMISAGENAGTVEILKAVIEEDGIHVTFTSMSPVMIMYQEKGNGSTTDGAASPETGDTRLLWPALIPMFISGTALAILAFKRKESKR